MTRDFTQALDPQQRGRATYHGKWPATVLDNQAQDGLPPGVIVVEIHAFNEDDPASPGALRPMQRKAWPCLPPGAFIVPDIASSVWVEFIGGDPRHPLWSGAWYGVDAAPQTHEDKAPTIDQRLWRSVAGSVVLLDDTDGATQLVLREPNANTLTMNKDGIAVKCGDQVDLTMTPDALVVRCGDNKITLDGDGIKLAGAGHELTLESAGLKLDGKALTLEGLLDYLTSHTHPTPAGASSAPTTPPTPDLKSAT